LFGIYVENSVVDWKMRSNVFKKRGVVYSLRCIFYSWTSTNTSWDTNGSGGRAGRMRSIAQPGWSNPSLVLEGGLNRLRPCKLLCSSLLARRLIHLFCFLFFSCSISRCSHMRPSPSLLRRDVFCTQEIRVIPVAEPAPIYTAIGAHHFMHGVTETIDCTAKSRRPHRYRRLISAVYFATV